VCMSARRMSACWCMQQPSWKDVAGEWHGSAKRGTHLRVLDAPLLRVRQHLLHAVRVLALRSAQGPTQRISIKPGCIIHLYHALAALGNEQQAHSPSAAIPSSSVSRTSWCDVPLLLKMSCTLSHDVRRAG
jgi:hypothetical protein